MKKNLIKLVKMLAVLPLSLFSFSTPAVECGQVHSPDLLSGAGDAPFFGSKVISAAFERAAENLNPGFSLKDMERMSSRAEQVAFELGASEILLNSFVLKSSSSNHGDRIGRQKVDFVQVDRSQAKFTYEGKVPAELMDFLSPHNDRSARWLKHPMNRGVDVPYAEVTPTGVVWGFFSASRSMYFAQGNSLFSIKLPSRAQAHPPKRGHVDKARLAAEIPQSLKVSKFISDVDNKIGVDPELVLLLDRGVPSHVVGRR